MITNALVITAMLQSMQPSMTPTTDERIRMAPIVVPHETKRDRRPIYVGAGLVLVAAGLWWNRKKRERFGKDESEPKPEPKSTDHP